MCWVLGFSSAALGGNTISLALSWDGRNRNKRGSYNVIGHLFSIPILRYYSAREWGSLRP